MKKVLLVGLNSYDNLGDRILLETCEYLVRRAIKSDEISIEKLDLMKTTKSLSEDHQISFICKMLSYLLTLLIELLTKRFPLNSRILFCLYTLKNKVKYNSYFQNYIEKSDGIIFVGGAYLKFRGEEFQYSIRNVLRLSNKCNVPVMLNAIGIEGYDENDIRCTSIKQHINFNNVKIITTRDEKAFLLDNFIENKNIVIDEVADPALWIRECYGVNKCPKYDVGINIAYLSLFSAYGVKSKLEYKELIESIICELDRRKITYALFCNGKIEDYCGGKELAKEFGKSMVLFEKPNFSKEYIQQVSNFKTIIPTRLHALITAYALGIGSAGFIWNHKVDTFLEKTNQSVNFQDVSELEVEKIVDRIEQLICCDDSEFSSLEELKERTYYYIDKFINEYVIC